jgi:hypothetical protein
VQVKWREGQCRYAIDNQFRPQGLRETRSDGIERCLTHDVPGKNRCLSVNFECNAVSEVSRVAVPVIRDAGVPRCVVEKVKERIYAMQLPIV